MHDGPSVPSVSAAISDALPTATILPSRTATASAPGASAVNASAIRLLPLRPAPGPLEGRPFREAVREDASQAVSAPMPTGETTPTPVTTTRTE